MTASEEKSATDKRVEKIMEWSFIVSAFAIFLFAMVSTLASSGHEAQADKGEAHGHAETPSSGHH